MIYMADDLIGSLIVVFAILGMFFYVMYTIGVFKILGKIFSKMKRIRIR